MPQPHKMKFIAKGNGEPGRWYHEVNGAMVPMEPIQDREEEDMPNVKIAIPHAKWKKLNAGVEINEPQDVPAVEVKVLPVDDPWGLPPVPAPQPMVDWFIKPMGNNLGWNNRAHPQQVEAPEVDFRAEPEDEFCIFIVEGTYVDTGKKFIHSVHLSDMGADAEMRRERDKWKPGVYSFTWYRQRVME